MTASNPNSVPNSPMVVRFMGKAPVLFVTVDHEGIDNDVYEMIPIKVNGEKLYLFGRKRGKIKTINPNVIKALFNMGKIAFFINERCSNSMDHCVIYNTPVLFDGKVKDVIVLPKGLRIQIDDEERYKWCVGEDTGFSELERFLKMIGYEGYSYMAFAVAEGVDVIYVFDYALEVLSSVVLSNIDINDMKELQGNLMYKKLDVKINMIFDGKEAVDYFRRGRIKVYNHEILFYNSTGSSAFPIVIFIPASALGSKGAVHVIVNDGDEPIKMTVRSSEHGEASEVIEPGKAIVLYHPSPSLD